MAVTLAGGQSGDRFLTGSRFLWSSQWMEGAVRLGGGGGGGGEGPASTAPVCPPDDENKKPAGG